MCIISNLNEPKALPGLDWDITTKVSKFDCSQSALVMIWTYGLGCARFGFKVDFGIDELILQIRLQTRLECTLNHAFSRNAQTWQQ